jgi:hypothetical protein
MIMSMSEAKGREQTAMAIEAGTRSMNSAWIKLNKSNIFWFF